MKEDQKLRLWMKLYLDEADELTTIKSQKAQTSISWWQYWGEKALWSFCCAFCWCFVSCRLFERTLLWCFSFWWCSTLVCVFLFLIIGGFWIVFELCCDVFDGMQIMERWGCLFSQNKYDNSEKMEDKFKLNFSFHVCLVFLWCTEI